MNTSTGQNAEAQGPRRSKRIRAKVIFGGKESQTKLQHWYKRARDEVEFGLNCRKDEERAA